MLIDGRLVPTRGILRADVAIVGAGPAGITVATELARNGIGVLLLDAAGRHHTRADDDALSGEGSGVPFPLVRSRRRGFGGTSGHWGPATGLRIRPLDDIDLAARDPRPDEGWPFGSDVLGPCYERAHEAIDMPGTYAPGTWGLESAPSPLVTPSGPQLAMFRFAPHDAFTHRFDELTATPYLDVALHTTVSEIVLGADGEVTSLAVRCPGGNEFTIEAASFVLAAGGIDNARVLLASPGRTGAGVGNEHDNVGRYFNDHLSVDTGIIEPHEPLDVELFREQGEGAERHQAMLWLGPEIIEREGLLNAAFWINDLDAGYLSTGVGAARLLRGTWHSTPRRDLLRHAATTVRSAPDIARFAVGKVARRPGPRAIALRAMTEQAPDRDSRITLSPQRDALGIPRVHLDWRVSPLDLQTVRRHQDVLAGELERLGVGTVGNRFDPDRPHRSPIMSNYHHMGATRMHGDPTLGVVDAECRVHGAPNLYVAGSSVFPAGGYLNPTLTIIALAIRIADSIRRDLTDRAAVASPTT